MLTHDALKHDVSQRISRVQDMMREKDLSALLVFGSGAPGSVARAAQRRAQDVALSG